MRVLFVLLLLCSSMKLSADQVAAASTVEQLLDSGQLQVDYRLLPETDIVPGQPVSIEVEVATDRWYAQGTRLEDFEIDGATVYRGSQNSSNSSRREGSQSWAVQLQTIQFYPQRAGRLQLPPLRLFVSVNTEGGGVVEGTLTLPARDIEVVTPAAMVGLEDWLASSDIRLDEQYEGLKEAYQPGDAITRRVSLQIDGAPAMMLPALSAAKIDGLALYLPLPVVSERSNRGELTGYRQQQFIYTVEKPGHYTLPAITLEWWDLDAGERRLSELPALEFEAAGGTVGASAVAALWPAKGTLLLSLGVLLVLLAIGWRLRGNAVLNNVLQRYQRRRVRKKLEGRFQRALHNQDAQQALALLFRLSAAETLLQAFDSDEANLRLLARLKRSAYGAIDGGQRLTAAEGGRLLLGLRRIQCPPNVPFWRRSLHLRLNPPA